MAQRTVVELIDDITGDKADETISFGLDGAAYEIDLSAANAAKLRETAARYAEKARRKSDRKSGATKPGLKADVRTVNSRERSSDIRAWAKQRGITVNDRGRIPAQVVEAYEAKQPAAAPQVTFRS